MILREGERILKVYHHHATPFILDILKAIFGVIPFFLIIFFARDHISSKAYIISHLVIIVIFALIIAYVSMVYWLDKLVITNLRIVFINWKRLTKREESEALLNDIQDIQIHEKGIFSHFSLLDYGSFTLETASSRRTIHFEQAPDPEGIRRYIYHVRHQ